MAYLLVVLAFGQADLKAAQERYKALKMASEKEFLEHALRNARAGRTQNSVVRAAEKRLELWRSGLYSPSPYDAGIPSLPQPSKMSAGDVGSLPAFIVDANNDDGTSTIYLARGVFDYSGYHDSPAILVHDKKLGDGRHSFMHYVPFWVKEVRKSGKLSVPVIERLPTP